MRIRLLSAAAACLALLSSCSKGNEQEQNPTPSGSLKASPAAMMFTAEEATPKTVTVTAENTDWTYEISEGWVTAAREANLLNVSVSANADEKMREATITISATEPNVADVRVIVRQEGFVVTEPSLSISATELKFNATGNSAQNIAVTTEGGVEWSANADEEWILLTMSDNTLSVNVADNPVSLSRGGMITVFNTNRDLDTTVKALYIGVSQEPLDVEPSLTLVGLPEEGIVFSHYSNGYIERNFDGITVQIEPQWAEWNVASEGGSEWLSVSSISNGNGSKLSLGVRDSGIYYTDEGEAVVTVVHNNDPDISVSFTVRKTAMMELNSESTVTENKHIEATKAYAGLTTYEGYDMGYSHVRLAFYTDDVEYDIGYFYSPSNPKIPYHRYRGVGEVIQMTLYDVDDPTLEEFNTGTYQIDAFNGQEPGTAAPGYTEMFGGRRQIYDCSYALIDNDVTEDVEYAMLNTGSVTITKEGDEYHIEWSMHSDNGYAITGSYTGPLNINVIHQKNPQFGSDVGNDWGM